MSKVVKAKAIVTVLWIRQESPKEFEIHLKLGLRIDSPGRFNARDLSLLAGKNVKTVLVEVEDA